MSTGNYFKPISAQLGGWNSLVANLWYLVSWCGWNPQTKSRFRSESTGGRILVMPQTSDNMYSIISKRMEYLLSTTPLVPDIYDPAVSRRYIISECLESILFTWQMCWPWWPHLALVSAAPHMPAIEGGAHHYGYWMGFYWNVTSGMMWILISTFCLSSQRFVSIMIKL